MNEAEEEDKETLTQEGTRGRARVRIHIQGQRGKVISNWDTMGRSREAEEHRHLEGRRGTDRVENTHQETDRHRDTERETHIETKKERKRARERGR